MSFDFNNDDNNFKDKENFNNSEEEEKRSEGGSIVALFTSVTNTDASSSVYKSLVLILPPIYLPVPYAGSASSHPPFPPFTTILLLSVFRKF